jgi:hypothetical protein
MYPHYAYILRKKVVGWNVSPRLMLPHSQMIRFVYRRGTFYPQWSRLSQKNPVYGIMIIHTVKSNQHSLSVNVGCGMVSLVTTSSLDRTSSRKARQVTLTETIYNMNCQRSFCFTGPRRKFLHEHDLRRTTSTTEHHLILAASSGIIWIGNSLNRWTGRGSAQNWPPRPSNLNSDITVCGVTKKLWRTDARWTRDKNCFYEFSMLQDA